MDEIAANAGVARSTVYVYFANRDELLAGLRAVDVRPVGRDLRSHLRGHASPLERLRAVFSGVLGRIDENPAFFRLAMATQSTVGAAGSAAVGGALMMIGLDMIRLLEDIVTSGVASGDFRADLDKDRAVALIGQQMYGALSVRAGEPESVPVEQAADEICQFVVHGLGR